MVRSLWFKLMGAFALVILVGVAIVMYATLRTTTGQFELYIGQQGQSWAQSLVPGLADYYMRIGSWRNVQSILQNPSRNVMDDMMGRGGTMMGGDMLTMMGHRLVLADATGTVAADTANVLVGIHLSDNELSSGTPIVAQGHRVGTLLVATLDAPTSPISQFRRSVSMSVLISGGIAGVIALLMGSLLFFQVTLPMRRLSRAAQGIAAGDLSQRVPASDDEVGQVAHSFNTMAESLQRMEQQRQNMIADIAHELRTPLSVIQGNVEAMLDGVLPTSPEELESIHQETLLLNRLIGDLRTLSLAEAGQLTLDKQPLDLGEVVVRVAEKYRARAEGQNVTLSVQVAPDLAQVLADAGRIEQVLSNLTENALQYGASDSGGRVTLGARAVPNGVEAWVSDTGPGIAFQDVPHVFERFWRSEKSRPLKGIFDSRKTGGSGIGLALVKQLVEAHGGRVSVESAPGQGATFHMVLPIMQ
jgi:two-component system OmpR family sensor kinase/two-component system sensor histidine kinase BaeS